MTDRTLTYTFMPEARPVIDELRKRGNVIEAARLGDFRADLGDRYALATTCATPDDVKALTRTLADAFKDKPNERELARWALIRLADEVGYIVAFPKIVASPVRAPP